MLLCHVPVSLAQCPPTVHCICCRAAGDALAQRVEGQPFDVRRNLRTACYGGAFIGPVGHAWYIGLDRAAAALLRPGTLAFVGGKVSARLERERIDGRRAVQHRLHAGAVVAAY